VELKKDRGRKAMDFQQKAKIRIERWLEHSHHHIEEYEAFARELEREGKKEAADRIRDMIRLTGEADHKLKEVLELI